MFYALALVLCLAVMLIVAVGASALSAFFLWTSKRFLHRFSPLARANLLFMVRALPWFLAGWITLGFALPAFLRFEPRSSNEMLTPRLLLLACLGALVIAAIGIRGLQMIWTTHRAQKQWRIRSRRLLLKDVDVPVYCTSNASPLLAVTGIFRPRIFVAQTVVEILSPGELLAAIAHELAHVSALDNVKQLILKTTRLPQWFKLFAGTDTTWLNASEIAADERALMGGASALDLSSALVKVARLSRSVPGKTLLAASHLIPSGVQSSVEMRVNHLRKLLESEEITLGTGHKETYWPAYGFLALIVSYAVCVNMVLPWMHEVLEMLVR